MEASNDSVLEVLTACHHRLATLVEDLDEADLVGPSYASKWTVADVLSHIGSGAVIMRMRVDGGLSGAPPERPAIEAVWDEWNAKDPAAKATDAVLADASLIDHLSGVAPQDRARFSMSLGPLQLGFGGLLRTRVAEIAVHHWDIAVVRDAGAVLAPDATEIIVDNLEALGGLTARPEGRSRRIDVATTDPPRRFSLVLDGDSATLSSSTEAEVEADVTLPSEAFVRLVYGRLDPEHTPPSVKGSDEVLDALRSTYPGF